MDGRLEPVVEDALTQAVTMSLSTPITSTQDGPRMTTQFGGKKAAPFVKGGGRSKSHPNDAKGRKRKAAKAAVAKARAADYSNVDLAFNRNEPRDRVGRWADGGPTWTPEKGARGPAEAKYLAAKNMLAKAVLAQDDKAIKKYSGKVAKRKVKFDRELAASKGKGLTRGAALKKSARAMSSAMDGIG